MGVGAPVVNSVLDIVYWCGTGIRTQDIPIPYRLVAGVIKFCSQPLITVEIEGLNPICTLADTSAKGIVHIIGNGSTNARIMTTLMYAMKKQGKSLGLATLCGGGVAMACAIEMI